MPSFTSSFVASLALYAGANAHMKLATPQPYGLASLNNSPLAADGSDFPCKQRPGVYDATGVSNIMAIGAPQTLSFIGGATHSGGSCQISLTKDPKPTKDSKWMVIHSIHGGCPDKTPGNKGEDANARIATKFNYSIPQGISPGQYTLAWTWFNQGGNREMYMNCAPVTVTGGGKKRDVEDAQHYNETEEYGSDEIFKRDASFPDMYRANIDPTCTTEKQYGKDLIFPHPGASVEKAGFPDKLIAAPSCGDKANAGSSSSPSAASGSGSGTGSSPAGAASPAPTSIVAIPPPSASGMGMASAAASVASAAQSVASAAASVVSGTGMASPATPTGSSSSGSSGGAAAAPAASAAPEAAPAAPAAAAPGSMACSTAGQTVCSSDGMKFGTCDTNKMAVMMAVAGGTKCSGGQIMMAGGPQKRSAKFARFYNA
ncbi:MAG: hypothetical protein LQ350_006518 [Teloschistes chrysophthalmus]|nr:MAG: hypothetical protein LQ350_006518 [Niorma chrysophthalma]